MRTSIRVQRSSRKDWLGYRWLAVLLVFSVAAASAATPNDAEAELGDGFIPFWVQTFMPTELWSGPDAAAVDFGPVGQFAYFRVVGPQHGPRLFVYNPRTCNYAFLDAEAAGPSGPVVQPLTLTRSSGDQAILQAELASSVEAIEYGLMGRVSMPDDTGMLFVLPPTASYAFWMDHTFIPLSIAFISRTGKILDIRDMEPLSRQLHAPGQSYAYALEVNQGWFRRQGIQVGDQMILADWLPTSTG